MKIFIVCNSLGRGGAERVGVSLANGFARRGHSVVIITDIYQKSLYHVDDTVKILPLCDKNKSKLSKWFGAIVKVRKYLTEYKPDAVIGIMQICSLISKIASLGLSIPIIATEHNSFETPNSAPLSRMDRFIKFYGNRIYDCVTVLTEADKKKIGNKLNNVVVMPNPLCFQPITEIQQKNKVVFAAGRLDAWHYKGFDVLIKSWGTIAKKFPKWRLQIAGTGSPESLAFLKELCKACSVEDSVDFLGFSKDIDNLFRKSEVFVLSSRYEGFGLVLIEAMSQGCACIACDYKGRQKEIITDVNEGLVCRPDDVNSLSCALKKMLSMDNDARDKMQTAAIERSKFYNLDNIIGMWESLLKSICKR